MGMLWIKKTKTEFFSSLHFFIICWFEMERRKKKNLIMLWVLRISKAVEASIIIISYCWIVSFKFETCCSDLCACVCSFLVLM